MFLTVTSVTVMCPIHTVRKNSQLHPIKRCTSGLKDKAHGEGPWKQQQRWKLRERWDYYNICLVALQHGENRWVQQTPGFISSVVIKLAKDRTSSFLRYDISEWLPPLGLRVGPEWLTETMTSDFSSCGTWVHLRLWDISWWWQIFIITKHMNEQVCHEKYLLC